MQIRKGYKYTLKTKRTIGQQFARVAGACRFVWNKILAANEGRYLTGVPRLAYHDAARLLVLWKQSDDYGWLKDVPRQVLQQCLLDMERAYTNLCAGRAHPPRFRKRFLADTFRYPQGFRVIGNKVRLPKIGWVRFWLSRPIEGTIKNVTVSRDGERWAVAFQVEHDVPDPVQLLRRPTWASPWGLPPLPRCRMVSCILRSTPIAVPPRKKPVGNGNWQAR